MIKVLATIFGFFFVATAAFLPSHTQAYGQGDYYSQPYYQGYYQSYYQPYYQSYYQPYYQGYYQATYNRSTGPLLVTTNYSLMCSVVSASTTVTVLTCPHGTGGPGACTSCDEGYVLSGGNCVLECPNGEGPAGLCTACDPGYALEGGSCVSSGPSGLTLTASATRVRTGSPAELTWSVSGLESGSGVTCSVTSSPSGVFSQTMPADTNPTWSGTDVATNPLTSQTTFTLACTGVESESITVGLIPLFEETQF